MGRSNRADRSRYGGRLFLVGATTVLALLVLVVAADRFRSESSAPGPIPTIETPSGIHGLFVEPDDGREPVITEIDAARRTVDVMVYLLTDEPVIDALLNAESRGVAVRVILEQHPYGGFGNPEEVAQQLRQSGAEVKWASSDFSFSHVKTIVVDRSVALIMNLNLTRSSFEGNRDFGVMTTRPEDVGAAQAVFDADWSGWAPPSPDPLVVSPLNSREVLTALIDQARESLEIYAEVVRDDEIVSRLKAAAARGVKVRMVVSPDNDPVNRRILAELEENGIQIRFIAAPYIHAKAVIVDKRLAFIGSQNFTETSLDENREIGILLDDPVAIERLVGTFEADSAAGETST